MKKQLVLAIAILLLFSGCGKVNNKQTNNINNSEVKKISEQTNNKSITKNNMSNKNEGKNENKNVVVNRDNFRDLASSNHHAIIETNLGNIKIKFYNEDANETVNNFLNLANLNFYDGIIFHRVIKDFMIQTGDPLSRDSDWSKHGTGGPGYSFDDEINNHKLVRGSVAMANSGPNTNGSQFFIVTAKATPWLDGHHTNFGEVVEGMDVVDKISQVKTNEHDHPLKDIVINDIKLLK